MKKKLIELISKLDPEIQVIVAEVIELEREHLDYRKPRIKENIRDVIDKHARHGLGKEI
jgi:hypothetical protein